MLCVRGATEGATGEIGGVPAGIERWRKASAFIGLCLHSASLIDHVEVRIVQMSMRVVMEGQIYVEYCVCICGMYGTRPVRPGKG